MIWYPEIERFVQQAMKDTVLSASLRQLAEQACRKAVEQVPGPSGATAAITAIQEAFRPFARMAARAEPYQRRCPPYAGNGRCGRCDEYHGTRRPK